MSQNVYFYNYDYKTQKHALMCRPATIDEKGTAHIELRPNSPRDILERPAGEWISEDMMKHDLLRCIHETLKNEVKKEMRLENAESE